MSGYPYSLKRRILSDEGHLSNVNAGKCLCKLTATKCKRRQVLLGHLSRENNDPQVAMLAVRNELLENDIIPGDELKLDIALRDCCSLIYEV
jgi:phosphoribosyl 1,2-cyclic phosphodiesterase